MKRHIIAFLSIISPALYAADNVVSSYSGLPEEANDLSATLALEVLSLMLNPQSEMHEQVVKKLPKNASELYVKKFYDSAKCVLQEPFYHYIKTMSQTQLLDLRASYDYSPSSKDIAQKFPRLKAIIWSLLIEFHPKIKADLDQMGYF